MDRYLETVQGTKGASQKVKLEEAVKHRESPSSVRLYSLLLVLFLYILYKRQGDTKFRGRWRLLAPEEKNIRVVIQKFLGRVPRIIHGIPSAVSTGRGLRSSSQSTVVSSGSIFAGVNSRMVLQIPWNVPRLQALLKLLQDPHVWITFDKVHKPLRPPRETTFERPKVVHTRQFFTLLTWTCASRHDGVHFFNISTSKSAPMLRAPQLFYTLKLLTLKCASRHNGVHFFDISTSKSGPNMRCFVHVDFETRVAPQTACNCSSLIWPDDSAPAALASLLFDPPEPQNIGKTQCFATFLPFPAPASFFFWLFLISDLLSLLLFSSLLWLFPLLLFHLSIVSEAWLLNFLRLD